MKGIYLNESDSQVALGLTYGKWRYYKRSTKVKRLNNGKIKKLYFIPYDDMTNLAKDTYASDIIDENIINHPDEIESILDDVDDLDNINIHSNNRSHVEEVLDDSIENQIALARLENLKQRTVTLQEKTLGHKRELFAEWTSEFVEAFEEAFGIFRNNLINLHLSEEQTKTLQGEIDKAISKMNVKLKKIIKNAKLTDSDEEINELMKENE